MSTCQVVPRERCDCVGAVTCRHRFLLGATATGELGILRVSRAVGLRAACGLLVVVTTLPARAQTCTEPPDGMRGWWPGDQHSLSIVPPYDEGVLIGGAGYTFRRARVSMAGSVGER